LPPDFAVSKSAPTTVEPGGQVTWTIVVRNLGPGMGGSSTFEDPIPAGITNVSAVGCAVAGDRVRCLVGPIAPGASKQIQVTGTAPATTSTCFTNAAKITHAQDRDTSNNAASATSCTRAPLSDVRIEKSAAALVVLHGAEVRYTLRVTNAGLSRGPRSRS
jgi:uncharacterized repeat protein (TIGR01451 family)